MNWNDAPKLEEEAPLKKKLGKSDRAVYDHATAGITEESLAADAENDVSVGNIQELEGEIARTTDPKIRDVLVTEHNRIKAAIPQMLSAEATPIKLNAEVAPPSAMTWDQAPEEKEETWMQAPEMKADASWWDTIRAIPGTAWGQIKQGVGGKIQQLAEADPLKAQGEIAAQRGGGPDVGAQEAFMQEQLAKREGKKAPGQEEREQSPLAQTGRELYQEGVADVEAANPGELDFWKKSVLSGGASALTMAPAIALGAVSPPAGIALAIGGGSAQAEGQTYGENRAQGTDPTKAGTHAAVAGAAEAVFEFLPAKFLMDSMGGPVLKSILGFMWREQVGEALTTTVNSINAKYSTRPDMTWEEYGQDLLDTFGSVMVAAPLMSATGKVARTVVGDRAEAVEVAPEDQPIETAPEAVQGANNAPLSDPNIDIATQEPERKQLDALILHAEGLDPEKLTAEDVEKGEAVVEVQKRREKAPAIPQAELAWSQISTAPATAVEDVSELGASSRQTANADNYINPNAGERLDRQFLYGPEGFEGLTPRQVLPKAGTYTLGQASDDRPTEYLKAVHDTYEQWRQQYMPDATIVLSNEQLFSNSALGWHYSTGAKSHMIVPAVLRLKGKGLGQMNPNSQASAFYNATHEFGHALVMHSFFEGVEDHIVASVRDQSRKGTVSTPLPGPQAAVLREYNIVKEAVMSGRMTAGEFLNAWMGPAKIGRKNFLKDHKVAANAPAKQLVDAIVARAAGNSNITEEISSRALKKQLREDFLSIDEYLAEQVARHAYQRKWDQNTPLGSYFGKVLTKLREFFVGNKADQTIAAGVSFQEWIDGLSKMPRLEDEAAARSENKKKAGTRKSKTTAAKTEASDTIAKVKKNVKKKPVERVAHNVKTDTSQPKEQRARTMVTALVRAKVLEVKDPQYKELLDLVKRQDWDEFMDVYQQLSGKTVKFETDSELRVERNDPDWEKDRTESAQFKAWFGDWINDPEGSSKVRMGSVINAENGTTKIDLENAGPPLVTFAPLDLIEKGIPIHSSTVRGAMFHQAMTEEASLELGLVPVMLNIRNPLILPEETRDAPSPVELKAAGHDGVLYHSELDGDTSWVALDRSQVKIVPRNPYKGKVFMELDYDQSTPEGRGGAQFFRGVKNFLAHPKPLRIALRHVQNLKYHVLQLQHLAHIRPDLTDLAFMSQANTHYNLYKSARQNGADAATRVWNRLNSRDTAIVNKFVLDEYEGKKHWFKLNKTQKERDGRMVPWWDFQVTQETVTKFKEHGIDIETPKGKRLAKLILEVKNDLMDKLNEDEKIMVELSAKRFGATPAVFTAQVQSISYRIHQMRQVPFFPQGRFGNHMLVLKRKKKDGPGYEVVWKEAFESIEKWEDAARKAMARVPADMKVEKFTLTDKEYVLMSLPLDFLDTVSSELDLKEEQRDRLIEVLSSPKTDRMLTQREQATLGIKGYSTDAVRAYASYSWHHANLQAKMLYRSQFNLAINSMRSKVTAAKGSRDPGSIASVQELQKVLTFMQRARDYVMNPPNEMQLVRATVSLAYLWLNVKTAVLNAFGLMTTWASFSQRYGLIGAENRLAKAAWRTGAAVIGNKAIPAPLQRGLDRALKEGVLEQSYAHHLAGAANQTRMPKDLGRYGQAALDAGMFPFRLVELATRRISFLAELEAALEQKDAGFEEAYQEAVRRTNLTQNDYTGGNRVPFMRGREGALGAAIPLATIFASFTQHMAWHAFGGYEIGERRMANLISKQTGEPNKGPQWFNTSTGRIWLLILILGGYESLPGAENLIDFVEFLWRKSGHPKPIRQELRELIQSVDQDPHLWARGLGHNVAGLDVSRSIGLGRIIPGTDNFSRNLQGNVEEHVGNIVLDAMGVFGSFLKWGLSMGAGAMEGDVSKAMRKAPGGIGNIYNAYDWYENGVRGPNGAEIVRDPETGEKRDLTTFEIYAKAFGFQPTAVSEAREQLFEMHDRKLYWMTQRSDLMRKLKDATLREDDEKVDEARQRISDYNDKVMAMDDEFRKMRITGAEIQQARGVWRANKRAEEQGDLPGKKYRDMGRSVRKSFERPGRSEEY